MMSSYVDPFFSLVNVTVTFTHKLNNIILKASNSIDWKANIERFFVYLEEQITRNLVESETLVLKKCFFTPKSNLKIILFLNKAVDLYILDVSCSGLYQIL